MKQFLSTFMFACLIIGTCQAQCPTGDGIISQISPELQFDNFNASLNTLANGISYNKGENNIKGNQYLYATAKSGNVKFAKLKNAYSFESIRYNALTNDIEIVYQGKTKYIRGANVASFTLNRSGKTQKFVNVTAYASTGKKEANFAELVQDGKIQMLKKIILSLKKPDYNAALAVGEKKYTINRKTKLFLAKEGKLYLVRSKKEVYKFFASNNFNAKGFAKKNRIRVNREKGLLQLVQSYNKAKTIDKKTKETVVAKVGDK